MFTRQSQHRRSAALTLSLILGLGMILGWLPGRAQAQDSFDALVQSDFEFAARQLNITLAEVGVDHYPSTTKPDGAWNTTDASDWTSGFFPGSLWLMYQRTGAAAWQAAAAARQAGIEGQKTDTSTHDVGFKIFTSFGNGYRLTNNAAYRQVALTAAGSLAKRYSATVRSIRSSGSITDMNNFQVIIDNMMNLEILFWAARNGGDPGLKIMALNHALTTRANHVRADGSTYQVVTYDPQSGAVKSKSTNQGYNTESTWSRGQAWAVYGFTVAYRETGDTRFLDTARQTADYFINHLPADNVPYWDFELPSTAGQPRDSSAAAIAASGLLELSRIEIDSVNKQRYLDSAKAILTALSTDYLAAGTNYRSILLHGTRNNRSSSTDSHDTGLSYGDYYFLEALLRVPTQPVPTGTVIGRVTDRATNQPIAGATISSSNRTTTTDANGSYMIAGIAAASQVITASAAGYAQSTQTVSVPANGSVTADFALSRVTGAPIKAITFEGGSLTGPGGADSVAGTGVALETSAPITGAASARVQGAAYLQAGFTAVDDFYASFYLKLNAAPAASARIVRISNAGATVGNLMLTSNRTLQLRNGSSSIGSPSAALTLGKIYRVGLHQKKGAGSNAVLEAFLILAEPADAAFPATAIAKISSGSWTTQANQLQFGATNGYAINAVFDDILLDAAAMPGPGGPPPPPDTQPPAAPTGLAASALSASQIKLTWNPATDNVGVAGYRVYRDNGPTPIATVTAGTSYTDSGLAPATTHSYTVAAFDSAGNQSLPSASASATTPATPPPPGAPIKAITFEAGSLTGPSGADSLSGTGITLETSAPLKGVASAQFATASGYLTEDFAGVDELFVSFYLRVNTLPAADSRIVIISNAGTTVGNIVLRSTGALRLRVGTTTIGDSSPLGAKPAVYRVGLHQKRGAGGNAVLEAFFTPADMIAFGTPFATTTTGSWATQANRLRFGATNGQAINATFDEIILNSAAMPGP